MTYEDMVKRFNRHIGKPVPFCALEPGFSLRRMRWLLEEMAELAAAMQERDLVATADALADLVYFVIGTAVDLGIPFDEVFREVHRSNMTKMAGRFDQKEGARKDDGYEPPDLAPIVNRMCRFRHNDRIISREE